MIKHIENSIFPVFKSYPLRPDFSLCLTKAVGAVGIKPGTPCKIVVNAETGQVIITKANNSSKRVA